MSKLVATRKYPPVTPDCDRTVCDDPTTDPRSDNGPSADGYHKTPADSLKQDTHPLAVSQKSRKANSGLDALRGAQMKPKNMILVAVAVVCGLVAAFLTSQMSAKTKKIEKSSRRS